MPNTREDVIAEVHAAFPNDVEAVLAALDLYGAEPYERERERVQLAIVSLSQADRDKLAHFVECAKTDYRDVLSWQATGPLSGKQGGQLRQAALRLIERWGRK